MALFYIQIKKDAWMDDLQFYVHFNSISDISERWAGDIKRLCAMEPRLLKKGNNLLTVSIPAGT